MSRLPTVLLLHDQLMDPRIWNGFLDALSAHARPITLPPHEQPSVFYPTSTGWTEYLSAQARRVLRLDHTVDLAVASGWAAGTALSLVDNGLSQGALLVNPGPVPLLGDEAWQQRLDSVDPATWNEIARRFPRPLPEPTGAWADEMRADVIGPAAADYFIEMASSTDTLPATQHALAKQVVTENLHRLLPLSLAEIRSIGTANDAHWLPVAVRLAARCTAALSGPPGLHQPIRDFISSEAPELRVVELNGASTMPWLEDPDRLDELMQHLLAPRPDESQG